MRGETSEISMPIRVLIPTPMRESTGGKSEVEVAGGTVQAALADLGKQYPAVTAKLFDNGQVRRFINIFLNDEDIRYLDELATPVKDGDSLSLVPAVAGG
jgi:molybdopterin converting factor small subunit